MLWCLQHRSCLEKGDKGDTNCSGCAQQASSLAVAESNDSSEVEKLKVSRATGQTRILAAPKPPVVQAQFQDPELVEVVSPMLMSAP